MIWGVALTIGMAVINGVLFSSMRTVALSIGVAVISVVKGPDGIPRIGVSICVGGSLGTSTFAIGSNILASSPVCLFLRFFISFPHVGQEFAPKAYSLMHVQQNKSLQILYAQGTDPVHKIP